MPLTAEQHPFPIYETFVDALISPNHLTRAATFFSQHYGIWSPEASQHDNPRLIAGHRVQMTAARLRAECLDNLNKNIYVSATVGEVLVGNVFASKWTTTGGEDVCWVTQLVVHPGWRNRGIATELLRRVRDSVGDWAFCGILSSHPFAIAAMLRAFGDGLQNVDLTLIREHAADLMACDAVPVQYVRTARLVGTLFESGDGNKGTVSAAHTGFYVDHREPEEALRIIKEVKGLEWPFGELPEGCEFLALASVQAFVTGRQLL